MNITEEKHIAMAIADEMLAIYDKHDWCQNYAAKDEKGQSCGVLSDFATSFCMVGCLNRAIHNLNVDTLNCYPLFYAPLIETFREKFAGYQASPISMYNDSVLHRKDEAIEIIKAARAKVEASL